MRTLLGITLLLLVIVFASPSPAQAPVHFWSQRFGGTGGEAAYAVAVDGSGNVVVTGFFNGTVDFGGGSLTSGGVQDIFVARYNASGAHQWSRRFGSTSGNAGTSVAVDGSGNVVVTGYFQGTVNFGGGNLVSAGNVDIFVAKYNASGVHQWSQRFGSTSAEEGLAVAVDGSGNVVVTGYFNSTVNFGGVNLVSAGSADIFVAKYNGSGVHQWSQRFGSTLNDFGNAVAVDGSGNVVVTGYFNGTVNFGGNDLESAGNFDIFLATYNGSGVHQWSQRLGSTSGEEGRAVAVDGSGNVVVTGYFNGTVNFGGVNLVSAGSEDIFVAKYSDNVAKPLITSIADIGNDQGKKVRIQFSSSGHDAVGAGPQVTRYEAFRRIDALPSAIAESPAGSLSREQLLDLGWVQAAEISAHAAVDGYVMDAPTDADSTVTLGQHHSVFFIRATTALPGTFFDSPIDSGYSLDNLAPGVPQNFAYAAGNLTWKESVASDFDYFTVYGSNTDAFGAATVVDYSVAPSMNVSASPYVYYFVTATDFSGNEGKPAKINTLSDVGGTPKSYVLSVSNYPNPFNPRTTVSYTVPSRASVTVAIYDARGARVATLVDRLMRNAGAYAVDWDGRAENGTTVSSGVYFVRIEHNGAARTKKMVLLK